jgi:protein tyrosine phosphatase type 4A
VLQPRPSTAAGGAAAAARAGPPAGVCTPIAAHGGSFLITDAPSDDNLHVYIEEFKKHSVTALVRACEPTYGTGLLTAAGIAVHELPFRDGEPPPPEVEAAWLRLCEERFPRGRSSTSAPAQTVALHCVAGLGRSPVLVALFFIDRGMEPLAAVELVRKKRRGAINRKQLDYLCTRRPRSSCGGCAVA